MKQDDSNPMGSQSSLGHTQQTRGSDTLLPSYFSVEERSLTGWFDYLREYSDHIRFYDGQTGQSQGSWQSGIPSQEEVKELEKLLHGEVVDESIIRLASRADIASMLAFFEMMKSPWGQFDEYTDRHLSHYYRDVLGFTEQPPRPDKAHLVLTLEDDVPSMTLKEGTQFFGGEDASGKELIYETKSNAVLNHTLIERVLSMSLVDVKIQSDETGLETSYARYLLSRCFDSDAELSFPEEGCLTFGESEIDDSGRGVYPEIGFLITSTALNLVGGEREIKLRWVLTNSAAFQSEQMAQWFHVYISTAEGFQLIDSSLISKATDGDLLIKLDALFPSIMQYIDENTPHLPTMPSLIFRLKAQYYEEVFRGSDTSESPSEQTFQPSDLVRPMFSSVLMNISAKKVPGLLIENDLGPLDASKPFEPFGPTPKLTSKFHFTHPELLVKDVSKVYLNFEWTGRPLSFDNFYKPYSFYRYFSLSQEGYIHTDGLCKPTVTEPNDITCSELIPDKEKGETIKLPDNFEKLFEHYCNCLAWPENQVDIHTSDHKEGLKEKQSIFTQYATLSGSHHPDDSYADNIDQYGLSLLNDQQTMLMYCRYDQLSFEADGATEWPKYFSLTLTNNDFGHADYPLVQQYISFVTANMAEPELIQVPEPYTPTLATVSIDYESTVEVKANMTEQDHHAIQQIHPLGRRDVKETSEDSIALLPRFLDNGCLYIGIAGLETPSHIRLYFEMDPVDGSNTSDEVVIDWQYLYSGNWNFFGKGQSDGTKARITEDSTLNLLDSGIVDFEIPKIDYQEHFIRDGRFWIKISLTDESLNTAVALYSRIRHIEAQGVMVELVDVDHDASHFEQPLAAQSIATMVPPDPRIQEIKQSYPSFSGRIQEQSRDLNIRSSERLRHKNRALTAWDYEHLVLAEFPEVYLTRCFRESDVLPQGQVSDNVCLVVVPVNHNPDVIQPKVPLYLKRRIQSYINRVSPPSVPVKIVDPVYEEVQFEITMSISSDYDIDSVLGQLTGAINAFLTPWSQRNLQQMGQAPQKVYFSEIAQLLEKHPAAEMIYDIKRLGDNEDRAYIEPDRPSKILVPSAHHNITLLTGSKDIYEGIGKWRIEVDFKVS
ncbi:baseplate J/gp47 family protein [Algicola sagamiensis]|uniref:hypothetical protein n=1 Tax=Algicola sagamiensis TaxID=163869 RepID=UPI0012FB941B|nr:hypothetical protein [Algicola sagamiensis]